MILWLIPVVVIAGVWLYHLSNIRSRLYRYTFKHFNGPKPIPILGNALEFPPNDGAGIYNVLMKYARDYDRCYRLILGPDVFLICYNPKDIETILGSSTHITKSDVYRFTIPWLGYGLLTSTGAKWKSRRRMITPTFHFKILEDFIDIFDENGKTLVEKLSEQDGKPAFSIYNYINLYALDNICDTAIGIPINAQRDADSKYVRAVKDMCCIVNTRAFQPWLFPNFIFNMTRHGPIQKNSLKILHKHTIDAIIQRKELLRKKKEGIAVPDADDGLNRKKKQVFLDMLLESEESSSLTVEDIREEVDTFMFEGHDTVTSGISFTLYLLSQHPDIQEKVYQEQVELLGEGDKSATYRDYQEMKYLDLVLKEAQRVLPSVPVIGRKMHEDLPLSDGLVLPKNSQVIVLIPALHENPKVWENPHQFNPDNFLPENAAKRSPYAHVPFSAGPRNCIGQRFAVLEMKAAVSKVVRNFKLLPCKEEEKPILMSEMVLISRNGVNLRLQKRL